MQPMRKADGHGAGNWGMKVLLPAGFLVLAVGAVAAAIVTVGGDDRREATVPSGTAVIAALDHTVSTKTSDVGERVELTTVEPVTVDGQSVIPAGAVVRGEVTHAKGGGRVAGAPELTIRFTELEADGETYRIETEPFRIRGKSDAGESVAEIGGGAAVGGVVGGVLGGAKGALKGIVAGAAIGTGVAIATDGDDLTLPAGQKLSVRISAPVAVSYRPADAD